MANQSVVSIKALLEAGVHFGHRTRRWNPKMKPFIFTERNGIHIIDLQQTIARLNQAYEIVKDTIASGGVVLFVGTKKQAQESLVQEAIRCNMPYVDQRWLGGTLTNWRTIRQRIDYLVEMEKQQARGEFARLLKKEALMREREIARLNHRLGGLKEMRRLPNLLFIVDIRRDTIAVKEANILGIPIIALVDTNCDPDPIDYIIPSNDDAIRALKLMNSVIANAALEGQAILSTIRAEEEEAATLEEAEALERYLGPSTLAKIKASRIGDDEDDEDDEADYDEEYDNGGGRRARRIEEDELKADELPLAELDEESGDELPEAETLDESEQPETEAVAENIEASGQDEAQEEAVTEVEVKDNVQA